MISAGSLDAVDLDWLAEAIARYRILVGPHDGTQTNYRLRISREIVFALETMTPRQQQNYYVAIRPILRASVPEMPDTVWEADDESTSSD